jgi:hypothetical protein
MALYRPKNVGPVEARQHTDDAALKVISEQKGEQLARKGDWLVGSERRKVYVLSDAQFRQQFDPIEEPVTLKITHFDNQITLNQTANSLL